MIASPSELVIATGFSNAISFAPLRMPISTSGRRTPGGVQKQKMSGFTSLASADGSVLVFTSPSFAAAAASRCRIPAADAGELESRIGSERRGMVHAALAHAHDDDAVRHHFARLVPLEDFADDVIDFRFGQFRDTSAG